jgi:chemotaxis protein MotB
MRYFILIFSMFFLFAAAGCATVEKAKKTDRLEAENLELKGRISVLKKEKQELTSILQDKESQFSREMKSKSWELEDIKDEMALIEQEKEEAQAALRELQEAQVLLENSLRQQLQEYKAKLDMTKRGLVITFLNEVLFDSGKAKIKPQGQEVLNAVAEILVENVPQSQVAVEGHTDNEPIKYSGWKSNWELSSARALSVLHYFTDNQSVFPERLSAVGYGEYKPVSDNSTPEGRQQNRRVEIVILPAEVSRVKAEIPEE